MASAFLLCWLMYFFSATAVVTKFFSPLQRGLHSGFQDAVRTVGDFCIGDRWCNADACVLFLFCSRKIHVSNIEKFSVADVCSHFHFSPISPQMAMLARWSGKGSRVATREQYCLLTGIFFQNFVILFFFYVFTYLVVHRPGWKGVTRFEDDDQRSHQVFKGTGDKAMLAANHCGLFHVTEMLYLLVCHKNLWCAGLPQYFASCTVKIVAANIWMSVFFP